jgi:hypothetical protein
MGTYESFQPEPLKSPTSDVPCSVWEPGSKCSIEQRSVWEQTAKATDDLINIGVLAPLEFEGLDDNATANQALVNAPDGARFAPALKSSDAGNSLKPPSSPDSGNEELTNVEQAKLGLMLNALYRGDRQLLTDVARSFDDAKSFNKLIGTLIGSRENSGMGLSWAYFPNENRGSLKVDLGMGEPTFVHILPPQPQKN